MKYNVYLKHKIANTVCEIPLLQLKDSHYFGEEFF